MATTLHKFSLSLLVTVMVAFCGTAVWKVASCGETAACSCSPVCAVLAESDSLPSTVELPSLRAKCADSCRRPKPPLKCVKYFVRQIK